MRDEKADKTKETNSNLEEPSVVYGKKRIVFSTVETQSDIQLEYAIGITPIERLKLMRKLNDYAYKNHTPEKILTHPAKIIFTSYEYIPGGTH